MNREEANKYNKHFRKTVCKECDGPVGGPIRGLKFWCAKCDKFVDYVIGEITIDEHFERLQYRIERLSESFEALRLRVRDEYYKPQNPFESRK